MTKSKIFVHSVESIERDNNEGLYGEKEKLNKL